MQHDSHCDSLFESTPVDDSDDDRDNTSQEEGSAARKAARRFVDTEAGRSSGSEADDDAEDDDEEAGMDGFVVKDEECECERHLARSQPPLSCEATASQFGDRARFGLKDEV